MATSAAPADPMVESPPHYRAGTVYEAIRVIEAWELGFHLGNAVKYICRANMKDNRLQNLQKARWYLDREIQNIEAANSSQTANALNEFKQTIVKISPRAALILWGAAGFMIGELIYQKVMHWW